MLRVVGKVMDGDSIYGYVIDNRYINEFEVYHMDLFIASAKVGDIQNVEVIEKDGNTVLIGTNGLNLDNLPVIEPKEINEQDKLALFVRSVIGNAELNIEVSLEEVREQVYNNKKRCRLNRYGIRRLSNDIKIEETTSENGELLYILENIGNDKLEVIKTESGEKFLYRLKPNEKIELTKEDLIGFAREPAIGFTFSNAKIVEKEIKYKDISGMLDSLHIEFEK